VRRARRRLAARFPTRHQRRHALVGPPDVWKQKRALQTQFLMAHGLTPQTTFIDILILTSPAGDQNSPVVWRTFEAYKSRARVAGLAVEKLGALRALGHGRNGDDHQNMLRLPRRQAIWVGTSIARSLLLESVGQRCGRPCSRHSARFELRGGRESQEMMQRCPWCDPCGGSRPIAYRNAGSQVPQALAISSVVA